MKQEKKIEEVLHVIDEKAVITESGLNLLWKECFDQKKFLIGIEREEKNYAYDKDHVVSWAHFDFIIAQMKLDPNTHMSNPLALLRCFWIYHWPYILNVLKEYSAVYENKEVTYQDNEYLLKQLASLDEENKLLKEELGKYETI